MEATEQYFTVVMFIRLHKVDLTFEPVDEILVWHSIEGGFSYNLLVILLFFLQNSFKNIFPVLTMGTQGSETFLCQKNPYTLP